VTGSGVVAAISGLTAEHGELVAAATGRDLALVSDVLELPSVSDVSVCVLPWQKISSDFLHLLYESGAARTPVGIFSATSSDRLYRVISKQLGHVRAFGRYRRTDFFPSAPIGKHDFEGSALYGARSSPLEICEGLGRNSDLLVISAHSDGVDSDLGSAVLCPVKQHLPNSALTCVRRRWCHRRGIALDQAVQRRDLVPPDVVQARLLLMLACHAATVSESTEAANASLLERTLVDGHVGCAIASWGLSFLSADQIAEIARTIERHSMVGEAMQSIRALPETKAGLVRFALFGDPDTRLRQRRGAPVQNRQSTLNPWQHGFPAALLRGCRRNVNRKTQAATERLEDTLLAGGNPPWGADLQAAVLDAALSFGTVPARQWFGKGISLEAPSEPFVRCSSCGASSRRLKTRGIGPGEERVLVSCPTCGLSQDYSDALGPLTISFIGQSVLVSGPGLRDSSAVRVVVERSKDESPVDLALVQTRDGYIAQLPEVAEGSVAICAAAVGPNSLAMCRTLVYFGAAPWGQDRWASRPNDHAPPPQVLKSVQVVLRTPTPADADDIFNWASDPQVAKFLQWRPMRERQDAVRFVAGVQAQWASNGATRTWVIEHRQTEHVVGTVRATMFGRFAEIGFVVGRTCQRRGLGSEAVRTLLQALHEGGAEIILAKCDLENVASQGFLESLGFQQVRVLRSHLVHPNVGPGRRDTFLYRHLPTASRKPGI
jgi:ribosomal-protein-alanine N-acetyltransferase